MIGQGQRKFPKEKEKKLRHHHQAPEVVQEEEMIELLTWKGKNNGALNPEIESHPLEGKLDRQLIGSRLQQQGARKLQMRDMKEMRPIESKLQQEDAARRQVSA